MLKDFFGNQLNALSSPLEINSKFCQILQNSLGNQLILTKSFKNPLEINLKSIEICLKIHLFLTQPFRNQLKTLPNP